MKFLKCMVIILALVVVASASVYLCNDSDKTKKAEEAVMI